MWAVAMLTIVLQIRVNRRSRRTLAAVAAAHTLVVKPRWLSVLSKQLWNFYRLCLI
jgi:hypothetical protein